MGVARETENENRGVKQRILSRKEIEKEVVYDAFFDFKKAGAPQLVLFRVLNLLGITIVWLVTFVPGVVTFSQVLYNLKWVKNRPFLYLESTQKLFDTFSTSTLVSLIVITIIIGFLALYRIYFKNRGYFSLKFQEGYKKNLEQIEDKKAVIEFHFGSKLGQEALRKSKDWIVIAPEENIDTDEIELLYEEYIK